MNSVSFPLYVSVSLCMARVHAMFKIIPSDTFFPALKQRIASLIFLISSAASMHGSSAGGSPWRYTGSRADT